MRILKSKKRLFKSHNFHGILQKMAGIVTITSLIFFCAFLFKIESVPADVVLAPPPVVDAKVALSGERDLNAQPRYHRALHFTEDREQIKNFTAGHQGQQSANVREDSFVVPMDSSARGTHSPLSRSGVSLNTTEIPVQRLPQAIIIGVKKSGTRALLQFLRIHPDVESLGQEAHFFDRNYHKGLDWYRSLMPTTYKGQMTVEKTPSYFVTEEVPQRILRMNPEVKLILVVRDPVTRAISDYCQAVSKRRMRPFEEMFLRSERMGLANTSWKAIRIGIYVDHIQKWLKTFRRDQIHFVDGEKLITEPAAELSKVEGFLELPRFINSSHFYLNAFKGHFPCIARNGHKHCLDEKNKGREHPKINEIILQKLRDFYRPYNAMFYKIAGRDFGWP